MIVKFKRINPRAKLPAYAHSGDAGLDVFALETFTLQPGERKTVPLGFALEIEDGYMALIKDKSGLARDHGLHHLAGVCDAGYRGEYCVTLVNLGNKSVTIEADQKIAQLIILPRPEVTMNEADELSASARGAGGFGSTGKF